MRPVSTKWVFSEMEKHLENACAYLATNNKLLYHYHTGKADACRDLLENLFGFDDRYATEHIKKWFTDLDKS